MLSFLPAPLLGLISSVLLVVNLVFWMIPVFLVALLKLLIPVPAIRKLCMRALMWLATAWIDCNNLVARLHRIDWDIHGVDKLAPDAWYLVTSNHQSWVDIFVLQRVFNHRIPFLKFFIKQQLIWVPLLGFAWWAMEMPFMRRHSKEAIARNPELRLQDLEATRRSCDSIRHTPTTVLNFAEGTRFTPEKKQASNSPYQYLLRPKTGGLGLVLATLNETVTSLVDVTIVYPKDQPTFWQLLSGQLDRIVVYVKEHQIPDALRGNYTLEDAEYRAGLRVWLDAIWDAKDQLIADIKNDALQHG